MFSKQNECKIKLMSELTSQKFEEPFKYGWKREIVKLNSINNDVNILYITPCGKNHSWTAWTVV